MQAMVYPPASGLWRQRWISIVNACRAAGPSAVLAWRCCPPSFSCVPFSHAAITCGLGQSFPEDSEAGRNRAKLSWSLVK